MDVTYVYLNLPYLFEQKDIPERETFKTLGTFVLDKKWKHCSLKLCHLQYSDKPIYPSKHFHSK